MFAKFGIVEAEQHHHKIGTTLILLGEGVFFVKWVHVGIPGPEIQTLQSSKIFQLQRVGPQT